MQVAPTLLGSHSSTSINGMAKEAMDAAKAKIGEIARGNGTPEDFARAAAITGGEPVVAVWQYSKEALANFTAPTCTLNWGFPFCACCPCWALCCLPIDYCDARQIRSGVQGGLYILTPTKLYIHYESDHANALHAGKHGYCSDTLRSSVIELKNIGHTDVPPELLLKGIPGVPNAWVPNPEMPNLRMPDPTMPELKMPELKMPDPSIPDVNPDFKLNEERKEIHATSEENIDQRSINCRPCCDVDLYSWGQPTPIVEFAVPTSLEVADFHPWEKTRGPVVPYMMRLYIDNPEVAAGAIMMAREMAGGPQPFTRPDAEEFMAQQPQQQSMDEHPNFWAQQEEHDI